MPLINQPKIPELEFKKAALAPEEKRKPPAIEKTEQIEREFPPAPEEGTKIEEETEAGLRARPMAVVPAPPPLAKDPHLIEIEKILEEDLKEMYFQMPPEDQRKFRIEGEKTASAIWQMVETAKVKIKKVARLIRDWLKLIPGLNRFFLEQETKIKTDKIIALARKHK